MNRFLLLLVLLGAGPQDEERIRALIHKLASEEVTEREDAARELGKMERSILPVLRREQGRAADKETQGRISDVIEAMAAVAVFTPAVSPKATERLKDLLSGTDKKAHVVVFPTLGKALASRADVLILWLHGDTGGLEAKTLEALKSRKVIGFGRSAAELYGALGLEINQGACASNEETSPWIRTEKSALELKTDPPPVLRGVPSSHATGGRT